MCRHCVDFYYGRDAKWFSNEVLKKVECGLNVRWKKLQVNET
jgi:hypothetical protein